MYLLCNNISCTTARDLRDYIQEKTGRRLFIRWNPHSRFPPLIRYGNHEGSYRKDTNYNSKEFITMCCNKLLTTNFFREVVVRTPLFYTSRDIEKTSFYPIIIRTIMNGHGGIGIHVVKNDEEFNNIWRSGYYWTPFVRLSSEYRVIIFNGEPIKIFKKVREEGEDREDFPIRNNDNGYHFSIRENMDAFPNLLSFIDTKLKPLIPIGFYGLDIGKIHDSEDFFVLELNSAPGLNTNTITVLGDKLIETLEL
jgi:hypothetical protein